MKDKFIAIADLHLNWKLYNFPELEQDLRDIFSKTLAMAYEEHDVKYVFIVGDLFDDNNPPPDLVNFVKSEVGKAQDADVIVMGIAGDHDRSVNGESWLKVCGISAIETEGYLGIDYTADRAYIEKRLIQESKINADKLRWLFFHGQERALFPYVEEKKDLDLVKMKLLDMFPNLEGVILGDIHMPKESKLYSKNGKRLAYIGYCGSLGVIKSDEIGHKLGPLYYNGEKLVRLPYEVERQFELIDFTGDNADIFDIHSYVKKYKDFKGKKPVFRIEYDKKSEPSLYKLKKLYEIGLVRITKCKMVDNSTKKESISIRTELLTDDRLDKILHEVSPNNEIYTLLSDVLTSEPTLALDKFKTDKLDEKTEDKDQKTVGDKPDIKSEAVQEVVQATT